MCVRANAYSSAYVCICSKCVDKTVNNLLLTFDLLIKRNGGRKPNNELFQWQRQLNLVHNKPQMCGNTYRRNCVYMCVNYEKT